MSRDDLTLGSILRKSKVAIKQNSNSKLARSWYNNFSHLIQKLEVSGMRMLILKKTTNAWNYGGFIKITTEWLINSVEKAASINEVWSPT